MPPAPYFLSLFIIIIIIIIVIVVVVIMKTSNFVKLLKSVPKNFVSTNSGRTYLWFQYSRSRWKWIFEFKASLLKSNFQGSQCYTENPCLHKPHLSSFHFSFSFTYILKHEYAPLQNAPHSRKRLNSKPLNNDGIKSDDTEYDFQEGTNFESNSMKGFTMRVGTEIRQKGSSQQRLRSLGDDPSVTKVLINT